MTCNKTFTKLCSSEQMNIEKTLECGQCFRWNPDGQGGYCGVAGGRSLTLRQEDGLVLSNCKTEDIPFWTNYFDLESDYESAKELFLEPEYLRDCAQYGKGIRILRQDPWETLCSFIISQCNNIPRIKKIVETLCTTYGSMLPSGDYAFPRPEILAPLCEKDLLPLRCGYRAAYILSAARAINEGSLDFKELSRLSSQEAFLKICSLQGVGAKVANCFLLYGLHCMDRFPVDVWMKRALSQNFPTDFDPSIFGNYAGLAQQYIFYYARSNAKKAQ